MEAITISDKIDENINQIKQRIPIGKSFDVPADVSIVFPTLFCLKVAASKKSTKTVLSAITTDIILSLLYTKNIYNPPRISLLYFYVFFFRL